MGRLKDQQSGMTPLERRAATSLGAIYALRMLGLFMILPVFALYAQDLEGVTPLMIGLAISAYGLTQALLQIPFGLMSDRYGRKPVIITGLLIFAAGSVLAATATSIEMVIFGRALQGAGAIAAAIMALAADLTREEQRTKVMAGIGMSIGMAFVVSLVAGPILNRWIGVQGIFWLTALLAIGGVFIVAYLVPRPVRSSHHRDTQPVPEQFGSVLKDADLLRLDFGILALHLILTAGFVVLPLSLRDGAGIPSVDHWLVYLPVMLAAVATMVPFIIIAEKYRRMKPVFLGAVAVLAVSQALMSQSLDSVWGIAFALYLFFSAFNLLEASLPSLISKVAPAHSKGTAMGVYASSQFFGAFLGGVLGGWAHSVWEEAGVFWLTTVVAIIWWLAASSMSPPKHLSSYLLRVGPLDDAQAEDKARSLLQINGVNEAVVIAEEGVAYLKVDRDTLDQDSLMCHAAPPE